MEEKVLRKLEYEQILSKLAECCTTKWGKECAWALRPSFNLSEIKRWQAETSEAKELLRLHPDFSLGTIRDLRGSLNKAKRGSLLEPPEFLLIKDTLLALRQTKQFFKSEAGEKYSFLGEYVRDLPTLPELEQEINKKITVKGEVSDSASAELLRIRKNLATLRAKARRKLAEMVKSVKLQKFLQDPLITVRNERYVIPLKQEYRNQVPGLIHDQSASGATLFVEPLVVVEINNEVCRYEVLEKNEVLRILRELSELVAQSGSVLEAILKALVQLDLIKAKGELSNVWDCGEPLMNEEGPLKIEQGRHPLLQGEVVPISLHLGETFDTLIMTGPNTGGKTVTLKTVGLFVLMAQTGLHLPAQRGTELPVFEGVYADIGDEQSIEQSLSTFSAHLKNIKEILQKANERSLVLLDELGAGTDPTEGAALAKAILEYLMAQGAQTIATTHYSELKSFAYNYERVENASVEFSLETLQPTYRLLIGIPGQSNALEISRKLGLPAEIVEQARSFLSQGEVRTADLIANLTREQLWAEKERVVALDLKTKMQKRLTQIKQREKELKEQERKVLQQAQKEAWQIVQEARRESEAILKKLKKARTLKREPEVQILKDELRAKETVLAEVAFPEPQGQGLEAGEVELGMTVFLNQLNQPAQVLLKPNEEGQVLVQAGMMKVWVNLQDLSQVEKKQVVAPGQTTGMGKIVSGKAKMVKNEVHLRGLTVDEALLEMEKYLDDAYLAGLPQVRIIHGKGKGILRKAVFACLKEHHLVSTFRIGHYGEGGLGVTIVDLIRD